MSGLIDLSRIWKRLIYLGLIWACIENENENGMEMKQRTDMIDFRIVVIVFAYGGFSRYREEVTGREVNV